MSRNHGSGSGRKGKPPTTPPPAACSNEKIVKVTHGCLLNDRMQKMVLRNNQMLTAGSKNMVLKDTARISKDILSLPDSTAFPDHHELAKGLIAQTGGDVDGCEKNIERATKTLRQNLENDYNKLCEEGKAPKCSLEVYVKRQMSMPMEASTCTALKEQQRVMEADDMKGENLECKQIQCAYMESMVRRRVHQKERIENAASKCPRLFNLQLNRSKITSETMDNETMLSRIEDVLASKGKTIWTEDNPKPKINFQERRLEYRTVENGTMVVRHMPIGEGLTRSDILEQVVIATGNLPTNVSELWRPTFALLKPDINTLFCTRGIIPWLISKLNHSDWDWSDAVLQKLLHTVVASQVDIERLPWGCNGDKTRQILNSEGNSLDQPVFYTSKRRIKISYWSKGKGSVDGKGTKRIDLRISTENNETIRSEILCEIFRLTGMIPADWRRFLFDEKKLQKWLSR